MNNKKLILDICAGTGSFSEPYKKSKKYTVIRIDIKDINNSIDIIKDIRMLEYKNWNVYGILASPPCTIFSLAGNRWERTKDDYLQALSIVDACLRLVIIYMPKFWVLENPVGKLSKWLGPPRYVFDPYFFGNAYTKKTALWGNFNIPRLSPVVPIWDNRKNHSIDEYFRRIGNKMETKKLSELRAITPAGFARKFMEANR